jgi:hypothetical protein
LGFDYCSQFKIEYEYASQDVKPVHLIKKTRICFNDKYIVVKWKLGVELENHLKVNGNQHNKAPLSNKAHK